MITRREWLTCAAGSILLGCSGGGGRSQTGPTGPTGQDGQDKDRPRRAPSPIGYSHVLRLDGPGTKEVAAAGGLLVQAELFNSDTLTTLAKVREAADVMRAVGGHVLITALNVNDHPIAETLSGADFDQRIRDVFTVVGSDGVWLEAVSDGDPNFRGFQDRARQIWPGQIVTTLHPCSVERALGLLSPDRWVVTDCTPTLAANLDEAAIKSLVREAASKRAILLLYDTAPQYPWNSTVIRWMKESL